MFKKSILTAALLIGMSAAPSVSAQTDMSPDPLITETVAPTDNQTAVEGNWTDSKEVNYVEESELARKMNQARKAREAETYDKYGGGITIMSMCIVLSALIVLSLLFLCFGKISSVMLTKRKKEAVSRKTPDTSASGNDSLDTSDVIAAIAAALSEHFSTDHDIEDTILTIRRMKKAYSPWNSKIYNMRHTPELVHNPASPAKKK